MYLLFSFCWRRSPKEVGRSGALPLPIGFSSPIIVAVDSILPAGGSTAGEADWLGAAAAQAIPAQPLGSAGFPQPGEAGSRPSAAPQEGPLLESADIAQDGNSCRAASPPCRRPAPLSALDPTVDAVNAQASPGWSPARPAEGDAPAAAEARPHAELADGPCDVLGCASSSGQPFGHPAPRDASLPPPSLDAVAIELVAAADGVDSTPAPEAPTVAPAPGVRSRAPRAVTRLAMSWAPNETADAPQDVRSSEGAASGVFRPPAAKLSLKLGPPSPLYVAAGSALPRGSLFGQDAGQQQPQHQAQQQAVGRLAPERLHLGQGCVESESGAHGIEEGDGLDTAGLVAERRQRFSGAGAAEVTPAAARGRGTVLHRWAPRGGDAGEAVQSHSASSSFARTFKRAGQEAIVEQEHREPPPQRDSYFTTSTALPYEPIVPTPCTAPDAVAVPSSPAPLASPTGSTGSTRSSGGLLLCTYDGNTALEGGFAASDPLSLSASQAASSSLPPQAPLPTHEDVRFSQPHPPLPSHEAPSPPSPAANLPSAHGAIGSPATMQSALAPRLCRSPQSPPGRVGQDDLLSLASSTEESDFKLMSPQLMDAYNARVGIATPTRSQRGRNSASGSADGSGCHSPVAGCNGSGSGRRSLSQLLAAEALFTLSPMASRDSQAASGGRPFAARLGDVAADSPASSHGSVRPAPGPVTGFGFGVEASAEAASPIWASAVATPGPGAVRSQHSLNQTQDTGAQHSPPLHADTLAAAWRADAAEGAGPAASDATSSMSRSLHNSVFSPVRSVGGPRSVGGSVRHSLQFGAAAGDPRDGAEDTSSASGPNPDPAVQAAADLLSATSNRPWPRPFGAPSELPATGLISHPLSSRGNGSFSSQPGDVPGMGRWPGLPPAGPAAVAFPTVAAAGCGMGSRQRSLTIQVPERSVSPLHSRQGSPTASPYGQPGRFAHLPPGSPLSSVGGALSAQSSFEYLPRQLLPAAGGSGGGAGAPASPRPRTRDEEILAAFAAGGVAAPRAFQGRPLSENDRISASIAKLCDRWVVPMLHGRWVLL